MIELWQEDAWVLADRVRSGELSAVELLELHLERIDGPGRALNAICFLDADGARRAAADVDRRVAAGDDPGPWAGVPVGVKELAQVAGMPDTGASVLYADRVATRDCAEVARLRGAGAVVVGLTTAPEFGSVSFTNTPLHGVTRNPWDTTRTPGGSSGGSAAAVAGGLLPLCTGSDGGGSIRIPSCYSGLPGMKPTFGRIGEGPDAPFDDSLTAVHGPIARSVRDAARYLDVTSGPTLADPTSLPALSASWEVAVASGDAVAGLHGLRAAWSPSLGYAPLDPDVEAVVRPAAELLAVEAGLDLVDEPVALPRPGGSWGLLSGLSMAAAHLDDARGRLDECTEVVRFGLEAIDHLRPEALLRAIRRRTELVRAAAGVFERVDLLLTPTTPTPAIEAEGRLSGEVAGAHVSLMLLSAAFTAPFNMTGQPAITVPAGTVGGLPVGLQVVARRHDDLRCLAAAACLEAARPWPKTAPPAPRAPTAPAS